VRQYVYAFLGVKNLQVIAESSSVVAQPIAVNGHAILQHTSSEQLTALQASLQNFGNQREGDIDQALQLNFSPRCAVILNRWDSMLKSLFSFVLPLLKNSRSAPSKVRKIKILFC
jgi:hypothetical protein